MNFILEAFKVLLGQNESDVYPDCIAAEQPRLLDELDDLPLTTALAEAERQGLELARRLGVDGKTDRLPAFIWSIFSLGCDRHELTFKGIEPRARISTGHVRTRPAREKICAPN